MNGKHRWIALGVGCAILGAVAGGWILRAFAPFLVGLLLALAAEPLVRLQGKAGLGRKVAAPLSVTLVLALLSLLLVFGVRWALGLLTDWSGRLPGFLEQLKEGLQRLPALAPERLQPWLESLLDGVTQSGSKVLQSLLAQGLSLGASVVLGLPETILFLVTAVVSAFLFSARLPGLRPLLKRWLPAGWPERIRRSGRALKRTACAWAKAQIRLMGVTFLILLPGLLFLGEAWALPVAIGIAVLDALPVFGAGTILIPWALLKAIQGDLPHALGFAALYGVVSVTRTVLEPRIMGRQLGLHPVVSLMAMYLGWRLLGLVGMLLAPVAALMGKELLVSQEPEPLANQGERVYNQPKQSKGGGVWN